MIAPATSSELFNGETDDPYLLAVRAYVWGYAPIRAARLRETLTSPADPFAARLPASAGAPLNNMGHQRRLSDPTVPGVAPNVDTLYSLAWLDLGDAAFVLEAPDFGSRYYTFQIGYADTTTEYSLGARTHGPRLPPICLSGPGERAAVPEGMLHVRSHTRYLLVAGRILVQPDDPDDADAVHDLQSRIRLRTLSQYLAGEHGLNPVRTQRLLDEGRDSVDRDLAPLNELGNLLRDWVVEPRELSLVASFARIGVTVEHGFRAADLDASAKHEVARGIADAHELVERKTHDLGRSANGWTINDDGPRFGDDYMLRAAVAKDQIYVTVPEEAVYPVAKLDGDGVPLTGEHTYRLVFAPDALPPADAFWSVTVYRRGAHPLVPNPVHRYAIGDRTADLKTEPNGSLAIGIQHEGPADETRGNWLPAPTGPFHLLMRLYVPGASVREGTWVPPPIERRER